MNNQMQETAPEIVNSQTIGNEQPFVQPIGKQQIHDAQQILNRYKTGKANLEKRIVENEQWYKLRHWECMRKGGKNAVEPYSGWLFNAIANKHADAMDNFPAPNILPRERGDEAEARRLSSIIPVVLDQCDFEAVYDDVWDYKLKAGTGVYGVFWDKNKLNGLGDISICKVDLINLFWESGITDIQQSRNLFHVQLVDNDFLKQEYPELRDKVGGISADVTKYLYDDTVDTTDKSPVVDWYYRRKQSGKTVLHYCKYVGDTVLFATENEEAFRERGWYDHGLYPFVFDPLFSVEGTPCGFGYIDVGKSAQEYIDRGNQAILQNLLVNARPRHFIRSDGEVNEEEYADLSRDFIHVQGNLGQDSILPVPTKPLNNVYLSVLNDKINELKEVTGNRDISTGGTTSGVTAASAIAAMQEAGSKLSRDNIKASYRAFRKVVLMVIELIRQFYDAPRCFRIMGEQGTMEFVSYNNEAIHMKHQGTEFGVDMGFRAPLFDIEITAQKQSPYSKLSQNELALQFYSAGFFNPQMSDQALACLEMMDFDRKEFIMQQVYKNGTMYQQLMMAQQQSLFLAQQLDRTDGGNRAAQIAAGIAGGMGMPMINAAPQRASQTEALGGDSGAGEAENTKKARQRVADSTAPT
ncbi:MAG: hypothetical protein IIV13_00780 [Bacteroidaceae bacterium]|nr:hypothetical protein [Bacteroidaceae bacterium]MBQ5655893.1 hypothetical protein [Bacteroidaceae bacterium]